MPSFYEYQSLLVKRSLDGAVKWSGFGMTFITGILSSVAVGLSQVKTGQDLEGLDKAITTAKYAIPSFIAIMAGYFLIWFLVISPYLIWKEQKIKLAKNEAPELPINIDQGQTSIGGFVDENGFSKTKTGVRISSEFNHNTEVDVEIRHASISNSGHATLHHYISPDKFVVSSVDDQAACILEAQIKTISNADETQVVRRFIRAFRSGLAPSYIQDMIIGNHVHELNFIMSRAGYSPKNIKIYVRKDGRVTFNKPDDWPEYHMEFPEW